VSHGVYQEKLGGSGGKKLRRHEVKQRACEAFDAVGPSPRAARHDHADAGMRLVGVEKEQIPVAAWVELLG
jgi:hypothetical protein